MLRQDANSFRSGIPLPVLLLLVFFLLFSLSSCAPEGPTDRVYGFFHGVLHGFIIVIAIIGKLFNMDHSIYAASNTGFTYWLGYLIGVVFLGGGGLLAKR